ncbi:hypothetical protein N7539_008518 [Penicillium diatomitis]|uniref:Winged helix-turn helix domain-containing protein n=1 Tax=Penicillium diatomitis TaxID=2819901 RepID=A0A9W9WQU8_9EURO|nr:uncharacterized protein N7539_008518 [Penicillium diatomitis]KAJ5471949.1 hypothetical protein N7539_008518 [Penicillium diatomitis]
MAEAAECSERTIKNIRKNLRLFGSVHAPPNRIGRRRSITPPMLEALCDHLFEKPGLYLDEMAVFLWDEFRMLVTSSSIRRALAFKGWSKKTTQRRAKEQNAELREIYLHNLSEFESYHLIYVDESGCDKRIGFRRTGWSPLGVAPVQVSQFHRDDRGAFGGWQQGAAHDFILIRRRKFTTSNVFTSSAKQQISLSSPPLDINLSLIDIMAELVGVVSSAITFATLAIQVGKSVQTLKGYWDSMRDAPDDVRSLLREVEILGFIMADVDADLSRRSVSLALIDSQHVSQSLRFCKVAAEDLEALCKDLLHHVGSSSCLRRSYRAAKLVIRERKIEKHVSKLHNVVRLLMLSQQCYTRALIQAQPNFIAEEIRNLGIVSSHADVAEPVSAPHCKNLASTGTLVRSSKLENGRVNHRKSRLWLLRAPYWMTSRVLEITSMKTPFGWDWSLRTYNEVRWSSELDYYFRQGTLKDLQDLFASGQLSPLFREQGSGRSLLHYAICVDRNEQVVEFLLGQGVDPSVEGGFSKLKTPLRLLLENGRHAASDKDYPLLPFLRPPTSTFTRLHIWKCPGRSRRNIIRVPWHL